METPTFWTLEADTRKGMKATALIPADGAADCRCAVLWVMGCEPNGIDQDWFVREVGPLLMVRDECADDGADDPAIFQQIGVAFGKQFGVRTPLVDAYAAVIGLRESKAFRHGYQLGRDYARLRGIKALL